MKYCLIFILILGICNSGNSQIVINKSPKEGKDRSYIGLDTLQKDYIQVFVYQSLLWKAYYAEVDYGQDRKVFKKKSKVLLNEKEKMPFASEVAIINYFSKNGWQLISYDAQIITMKKGKSD